LFITGPWQDMKKLIRNNSIHLVGIVSKKKLKELLAISDYGLSPIFSHAAGTFLKVLAYVAGGLNIVASPQSLQGIDIALLRTTKIFLVRSYKAYRNTVLNIVLSSLKNKQNNEAGLVQKLVILCSNVQDDLAAQLETLIAGNQNAMGTQKKPDHNK